MKNLDIINKLLCSDDIEQIQIGLDLAKNLKIKVPLKEFREIFTWLNDYCVCDNYFKHEESWNARKKIDPNKDYSLIAWKIFYVKKIDMLHILDNYLTHIPNSIGLMSNLRYLNCQGNPIHEIPLSLKGCPRLNRLSFTEFANVEISNLDELSESLRYVHGKECFIGFSYSKNPNIYKPKIEEDINKTILENFEKPYE